VSTSQTREPTRQVKPQTLKCSPGNSESRVMLKYNKEKAMKAERYRIEKKR